MCGGTIDQGGGGGKDRSASNVCFSPTCAVSTIIYLQYARGFSYFSMPSFFTLVMSIIQQILFYIDEEND